MIQSDDPIELENRPVLQSFASGQGRAKSQAELKVEEMEIIGADEPAIVHLTEESIVSLGNEFGKQLGRFYSPKGETTTEKRDRISRERFKGVGWAEIAKSELKEEKIDNPTGEEIRKRSEEIRADVERYRGKR